MLRGNYLNVVSLEKKKKPTKNTLSVLFTVADDQRQNLENGSLSCNLIMLLYSINIKQTFSENTAAEKQISVVCFQFHC